MAFTVLYVDVNNKFNLLKIWILYVLCIVNSSNFIKKCGCDEAEIKLILLIAKNIVCNSRKVPSYIYFNLEGHV